MSIVFFKSLPEDSMSSGRWNRQVDIHVLKRFFQIHLALFTFGNWLAIWLRGGPCFSDRWAQLEGLLKVASTYLRRFDDSHDERTHRFSKLFSIRGNYFLYLHIVFLPNCDPSCASWGQSIDPWTLLFFSHCDPSWSFMIHTQHSKFHLVTLPCPFNS